VELLRCFYNLAPLNRPLGRREHIRDADFRFIEKIVPRGTNRKVDLASQIGRLPSPETASQAGRPRKVGCSMTCFRMCARRRSVRGRPKIVGGRRNESTAGSCPRRAIRPDEGESGVRAIERRAGHVPRGTQVECAHASKTFKCARPNLRMQLPKTTYECDSLGHAHGRALLSMRFTWNHTAMFHVEHSVEMTFENSSKIF